MGFWFLVGIARVFLVSSFHVLVGCVLGFFFLFLGGLSCFVPFVSSFLSFWGHGWPLLCFWGLRSSELRGWLFVCFLVFWLFHGDLIH